MSGGDNLDIKLALHLVASLDSLECADLLPGGCESINTDLSAEEILGTQGYGYIVLIAYDGQGLMGVEFALQGWPTGRGAPCLSEPHWCEDALTLGDCMEGGGITAFERCVEPDSAGLAILAYWFFGPADSADLPIHVSIVPGTYSDEDSLLAVLDCSIDYEADDVTLASGCTIGGTYSGTEPHCGSEEDGGGESLLGAPEVRFLGPAVQRPDGGVWINLAGENVDDRTDVHLESDVEDGKIEAEAVFLGDGVFAFRASTAASDLGRWSVVVSNGVGRTRILEDALYLVPSLVKYHEERCEGGYLEGAVSVKLRRGVLSLPGNADLADPEDASVDSDALSRIMDRYSVSKIERIFKGHTPEDTLAGDINGHPIRVDDLSQFYMLRLPSGVDPADVATDLEILPEVKRVWLSRPIVLFADTREPNDYFYTTFPDSADSSQWNLRAIGCARAWAKDTCSVDIRLSIIDDGIRYTHEDLGASSDSTDFPNEKVVGGWNFVHDNAYPYASGWPSDHGTNCAGIAAATTNNTVGMAGAAWNGKILAYRCRMEATVEGAAQCANAIVQSVLDSASVINMSWGFYDCGPAEAVDMEAGTHQAYEAGLTLVASGGNDPTADPPCPATYQGVIGVAKSTRGDYHGGGTRGPHIDVAAPTGVLTTSASGTSSFALMYGSSASAPHVSGTAALIQARAQAISGTLYYGEDICGLICASADSATSAAGHNYPNDCVGWGRVNVAKALQRLEEPYNFGQGPQLLVATGVDSYMYDTSLVFNDTTYFQYRCVKWVPFDCYYDNAFAWGMDRYSTDGAPPLPGDPDEMEWRYCKVLPQSMSGWGCTLESFVFQTADSQGTWIPCHPESLSWSYRVSGIPDSTLDVEEPSVHPPRRTDLLLNYPNPFNPNTTIVFSLESRQDVTVGIYDVSGRVVVTLADGSFSAGIHRLQWNGKDATGVDAASGIYFVRLATPDAAWARKLILLR